jgi:hypothetical protein
VGQVGHLCLTADTTQIRFVEDPISLDGLRLTLKLVTCPHCRRAGALIGHGFLHGYAEQSSEVGLRGRRFFCSNRGRRPGCGRTFSVALSTVLAGFVIRTITLFSFVTAVLGGKSRRAAWLDTAGSAFSLSTGYRLWRRLREAQSRVRACLCREAPPPVCASREPLAQLLEHLGVVVGATKLDGFAGFQAHTQEHLLGVC